MIEDKRNEREVQRKQEPEFVAGEYGEGAAHEATGVGPRSPTAAPQQVSSAGGYPDPYGNVAPGRYGAYGYSSEPGHPASYEPDARAAQRATATHAPQQAAPPLADDRLRELIRERLTEDPALDASDVSVEVRDGRVSLFGTVDSAGTRAEIEQCVENCGALGIENNLRALS